MYEYSSTLHSNFNMLKTLLAIHYGNVLIHNTEMVIILASKQSIAENWRATKKII